MRVNNRWWQRCQEEGLGGLDNRTLPGSAASRRLERRVGGPLSPWPLPGRPGLDRRPPLQSQGGRRGEHPPPLLRSMKARRVALEQIEAIVISYLHLDPVRGTAYQGESAFSLSAGPLERHVRICRSGQPLRY
jgi:hypothetical protein